MKIRNILTLLLSAFFMLPAMAERIEGIGEKKPSASNKRLKARCENASAQADLDINNVRARIMNGGDMWWDLVGTARYEIPKVTGEGVSRHSLFAGSIWIGGLNNGNIHTAAQTYRQFGGNDLWAGPIDTLTTSVDDEDCEYWDNIFQVSRDEIDDFIAEFELNGSVAEVPSNIADWPAHGRSEQHEARFMAPYINVGGGPGYDPSAGDYPDIKGDKALWYVYNDVGNLKTETGSPEIGLEFRTMAFGFATNDEINNMTFYETTIYNRGQKQLDSTYFGQWVDADLGWAFDDYVGCDIDRGLGICYNGDNFDEGAFGYGTNPPSVGVDFFKGPLADLEVIFAGGNGDGIDNDGDGEVDELDTTYYSYYRRNGLDFPEVYEGDGVDNNRDGQIDEPGEDIAMSKFVYYDNNFTPYGNPRSENRSDFYNYLTARWKNGDCIRFGGNGNTTATGECTDFMFPDDPRDADGWSEVTSNNQPNDRRFLQSAGPFTLKPGAVNTVTVGVVWARASSGGNTGSYDLLLLADDKAQKLFNNNFDLLDGPDAPELSAVELDREVILMMDRETYIETEGYEDSEISTTGEEVRYTFQGYQLYQLANADVTPDQLNNNDFAREVFQVDLEDGITRLVNTEYDPEVDASIPSVMVDGNDEGLAHVIRVTDDAFASGNSTLINHKTYHYLLIAYASVDADNTDEDRQYLAGRRITRISVTPRQTEILYDGTKLNAAYGDGPEITRIEGKGNGGIFMRLTEETVDQILAAGVYSTPTYQIGAGPVEVKVIDPLNVESADFELRFFDEDAAGTNGRELLANIDALKTTVRDRRDDYGLQQAITRDAEADLNNAIGELLSKQDSLQTVITELSSGALDEADSIVYAAAKTLLERQITDLQTDTANFSLAYSDAEGELSRQLNRLNNAINNLNDETAKADSVVWEITKINADGTRETIRAEKGLYTDNEMVLDEWGISIKAGPEYAPLGSSGDPSNGLIGSEIVYEDNSEEWLTAMPQVENANDQVPWIFDWIRAGGDLNGADPALPAVHDVEYSSLGALDENAVYKSVANGLIAPYVLTSRSAELNGFSSYGVCQAPSFGLECENFLDLPSIDLVFTSDRSKWSRVLVCEMGENPGTTEGGAEKFTIRQHASLNLEPDASGNPVYDNSSKGFSWFPGYAIDVETGERLNIILGENSSLKQTNASDMIWNPSSQITDPNIPPNLDGGAVIGGMHYIYVMGSTSGFRVGGGDYETAYDGCKQYEKYLNPSSSDYSANRLRGVWSAAAWVMPAMLADGYDLKSWKDGIVPTESAIRVRINRPYQTYATSENPQNENLPFYEFSTASIAPEFSPETHGAEALKNVRVVPNPYYAQSDYEASQIDNNVKITNLPEECTIKIYTVNGQLVKTFEKAPSDGFHNTELLWDLKNEVRVPISSGVYIIHVDAPKIGASTTVKFFAVIKPIDLDTF
ncbi:MAG: hypothetical protein JXQ87_09385 [Bacteroidia bacterium]